MNQHGIIIIKPNDVVEIVHTPVDMTLEFMQSIVGGLIEPVRIARGLTLIIDDEGKLKNYPVNRIATDLARLPYDVIVGTVFVCRDSGEELLPLLPEQLTAITETLKAYRPVEVVYPKKRRSFATPKWDFNVRRWRVQTNKFGRHVSATGRTAQEARDKLERKLELLEAAI